MSFGQQIGYTLCRACEAMHPLWQMDGDTWPMTACPLVRPNSMLVIDTRYFTQDEERLFPDYDGPLTVIHSQDVPTKVRSE